MTAARWAHLTYTSVDPTGGGAGGWQVKQADPLSADEEAMVLAEVPTALPLDVPLPRFPDEGDLAARPARLLFVPGDGDTGVFVHSVPAGTDASGRPGNVFTHAVLDRELAAALDAPDPVRPIEFWRAECWLTPYGPDEVREAQIGGAPIGPGAAVTRDTVVDFLIDPDTCDPGRLARVLDATATALRGGPSVVLVVETVDVAALWIGAVSFLAAPQAAMQLSFSTYDRGVDLLARGTRTVISAVPRGDAATDLGGPTVVDLTHPCPDAPAESAWAVLVTGLLAAGDQEFDERLLIADAISELSPVAARACPWWPLALAAADSPAARDCWPAAARTLLGERQAGRAFSPSLVPTITRLLGHTVAPDAPTAWQLLLSHREQQPGHSALHDALRAHYLACAFSDVAWLTTPLPPPATEPVADAAPAPEAMKGDPHLVPIVARAATAMSESVHHDRLLALLRFVDLAIRCGVDPEAGAGPHWDDLVADLIAGLIRTGPQDVLTRTGALDEQTERLLMPVFDLPDAKGANR